MARSQVDRPNFAYPKTVSDDAQKRLELALSSVDAPEALGALIVYSLAEYSIDPSSMPQLVSKSEQVAAVFADSDLKGVFDLFTARLYLSAYESERWTYDRRHLPLEPLPADITEWSGDQYKARIRSLALGAVSQECAARLSGLLVERYPQIVEADKLTCTYYPSMADFAFSAAASYLDDIGDGPGDLYDRALSMATSPASKMQWVTMITEKSDQPYDAFADIYQRYADSALSSLVLDRMASCVKGLDQKRAYLQLLRSYLGRFPGDALAPNLTSHMHDILEKRLQVSVPNICASGAPVSMSVTNSNTPEYTLCAYYIGTKTFERNAYKRMEALLKGTPTVSVKIYSKPEELFACTDSVSLSLPKPGYYAVVARIDGDGSLSSDEAVTYCVPVLPVVIVDDDDSDKAYVIATHPLTGKPVPGALVTVSDSKGRPRGSAKTDRYGIAAVDLVKERNSLAIRLDGVDYTFNNLSIYRYKRGDSSPRMVGQLLTDRPVYHPGDELNVMGVFSISEFPDSKTVARRLLSGVSVTLRLLDPNYQRVAETTAVTDGYGRVQASFSLPTDGLTGSFRVEAVCPDRMGSASTAVMVSDYRMPDFEVRIDAVENDVPSKGCVTVSGSAASYSGMPLPDTRIELSLVRSNLWRWWDTSDSAPCYADNLTTGADGAFSVVIPDSVFKVNPALAYVVRLDAVSVSGSTASASQTFSLEERYAISADMPGGNVDGALPLNPQVKVVDGKGQPCEIQLVWSLLADAAAAPAQDDAYLFDDDEFDDSLSASEVPDGKRVVAHGDFYGSIDLSAVTPGRYTLRISPREAGVANDCDINITVYNVASGIVPDNMPIWMRQNRMSAAPGETVHVEFATGAQHTYLYCAIDNCGTTERISLGEYAYGYHSMPLLVPAGDKVTVSLICVSDCRTHSESLTVSVNKDSGLRIRGESFRDNLVPGATETWRFKIVNADGTPAEAALALDMYNKALDALRPHSFSLSLGYGYLNTSRAALNAVSCYPMYARSSMTSPMRLEIQRLVPPVLQLYGMDFSVGVMYAMPSGPVRSLSKSMASARMESCDDEMEVNESYVSMSVSADFGSSTMALEEKAAAAEGAAAAAVPEVQYRDSDVPLAVWAPMLATDAEGDVCYTFTLPDANTTWRLCAVSWSQQLEVGSLVRDFVASKPVMVQPNLPRFLRAGDSATIQAAVMNNTDSTARVTATVEIFSPVDQKVSDSRSFDLTIGPKQQVPVGIDVVAAADASAIGYRVRVSNGDFTDGEQSVIRVLPNEQMLIETSPFYLNPGDSAYSTVLPDKVDARLSLTFCENPAWTIVTALPGLREQICDYANSAAAALYSAAVARGIVKANPEIKRAIDMWSENPSDSALVSMLEKNQDLKLAVLNSTPWVQAAQSDTERMANLAMIFSDRETDASIKAAVKILKDLQRADGGWAWGKWCDESSVWVTSNVLAMLGDLRTMGWTQGGGDLQKMTGRAVRYYDSKVEHTDLLYCLVRPAFSDIDISANGRKVIDATLADIRKHWERYSDPAYKAMAAQALWLNGDKASARKLMESVSQFGVLTKDQGLRFPSVNQLYDYAILLEAYATMLPDSKEVDGLRQQLIVRKQATDWGSAVVTMQVVRSILMSGTKWTVDASGASVSVDGSPIVPQSPVESATGCLRADLSPYAGQTLSITTSATGPAYGAVYAQYSDRMSQVQAASCPDLDIVKQMYVRRGAGWEMWTPGMELAVGDRVKVQLTIHSKRNLQYVSIIDQRPAAFAPVDQLPGWMWSEGVGFYRENRDAQTSLHVLYMAPGTYLLTYEMNVTVAGVFTSGVASIQSQYAPEIAAHSSGAVVTVAAAPDQQH